jgi:prophage regulatory protein
MNTLPSTCSLSPILRLRALEDLTGRRRSSIYEDMAAGRMPRQISLGPRAVGWLRVEIEAWLAARIAERDGPNA